MKLISLNTWGGRAGMEKLIPFFEKHADTDFFCLQEIWNGGEEMIGKKAGGRPLVGVSTSLLTEIEKILPTHRMFFRPHFFDYYGLAVFVNSGLSIQEEGERFVYKDRNWISQNENGNHARNIQYVTITVGDRNLTVVNFHGLWNGEGKSDSDDRLLQSERIISFVQDLPHPYVLAGDFNLRPETKSVKKLEDIGLRNMITEHKITSTRSALYDKSEKFADYVFVSDGISVTDFKVLSDEVSDHSPLLLEFS